ncbi:MAG: hypothetical protein FK730_07255 [Asgard group archaeon]|nr:hypothetical protein [Asgard group archaeon]
MGKSIHIKIKLILAIISIFLLPFSQLVIKNQCNGSFSEITDAYVITNFANFELVIDHNNIHSTNNITHVSFDYYGDYPTQPIYDRYQYNLPLNCSDFYISVKVDYSANETLGIFITYLFIVGEEHALTTPEVWDSWTANQARYYIKGNPNGIPDDAESEPNVAGLNGTVIFEVVRLSDILTTTIYDEYYTVLLTKQWTSGVSTLVSNFNINHRSGWLGAETHATFYDLYANFTQLSTELPTIFLGYTSGLPFIFTIIFLGIVKIARNKKK